jgi:hypothetical protein
MAVRPPASTTIVMLSMELLAVGLFTLLAGISDKVGKAMIIIMAGFWILFMLLEWRAPRALANSIFVLVTNPSNQPATNYDPLNPTGIGPSDSYNPTTKAFTPTGQI